MNNVSDCTIIRAKTLEQKNVIIDAINKLTLDNFGKIGLAKTIYAISISQHPATNIPLESKIIKDSAIKYLTTQFNIDNELAQQIWLLCGHVTNQTYLNYFNYFPKLWSPSSYMMMPKTISKIFKSLLNNNLEIEQIIYNQNIIKLCDKINKNESELNTENFFKIVKKLAIINNSQIEKILDNKKNCALPSLLNNTIIILLINLLTKNQKKDVIYNICWNKELTKTVVKNLENISTTGILEYINGGGKVTIESNHSSIINNIYKQFNNIIITNKSINDNIFSIKQEFEQNCQFKRKMKKIDNNYYYTNNDPEEIEKYKNSIITPFIIEQTINITDNNFYIVLQIPTESKTSKLSYYQYFIQPLVKDYNNLDITATVKNMYLYYDTIITKTKNNIVNNKFITINTKFLEEYPQQIQESSEVYDEFYIPQLKTKITTIIEELPETYKQLYGKSVDNQIITNINYQYKASGFYNETSPQINNNTKFFSMVQFNSCGISYTINKSIPYMFIYSREGNHDDQIFDKYPFIVFDPQQE